MFVRVIVGREEGCFRIFLFPFLTIAIFLKLSWWMKTSYSYRSTFALNISLPSGWASSRIVHYSYEYYDYYCYWTRPAMKGSFYYQKYTKGGGLLIAKAVAEDLPKSLSVFDIEQT